MRRPAPAELVRSPALSAADVLALQRTAGNRAVGRAVATVQRFDPAEYKMTVQDSQRNLLRRALDVVMESPIYLRLAAKIRDEGGCRVELDPHMATAANWHLPTRTIRINPTKVEQAKMVIAGVLAFELAHADKAATFAALQDDVRTGKVDTAAEYGKRAETIEYASASLRATASAEMMKSGAWNQHVDPQFRHFLPEGQELDYGPGRRFIGTGLWLTFEGFYRTQQDVGHTKILMDKFPDLPARHDYLGSEAGKRAEALKRYRERQQQRDAEREPGPPAAAETGTRGVEGRSARTPAAKPVQTTDPSTLLDPGELQRFWSRKPEDKQFRGQDGRQYRLFAAIEGTYYFKPV
ncbi:hypothetical protein [Amycolatopsis sp. lyj-23]|uniref:hypothetical protein n=1 Tax=Amycolatopsis sp. lyj-23 TaxID=2789283 RepID=UPI00397AF2B5